MRLSSGRLADAHPSCSWAHHEITDHHIGFVAQTISRVVSNVRDNEASGRAHRNPIGVGNAWGPIPWTLDTASKLNAANCH
jgi:hypothetical protein